MLNLNGKQIISIVVAVLGVLVVSTAQLTDLLGPTLAKTVTTVAGLSLSILSAISVSITGQSSLVKDVQAMPGVETITVNSNANPALAALAVDPTQAKVDIKPGSEATVQQTARDAA